MNAHYMIGPRAAPPTPWIRDCDGGVWFRDTTVHAFPAVPTERVTRRRPGARRAAIVATAIVAVSVLRPWGDDGARDGAVTARNLGPPPAVAEAAAIPSPSPEPSIASDQITCTPDGWQLVSLDHLGTWTVRSWIPAEPVRASGPLDPAIPAITLESPKVLAIGACAPATVDGAGQAVPGGPGHLVRAWRIDRGRAAPVALDTRRQETTPGVATLYRPRGVQWGPTSTSVPWSAGHFVLEVAPPGTLDGAGPDRPPNPTWFVGILVRGPG
jgi:hypothetical protein